MPVSKHVRNASRARFVTARDCPYCERHMTQEFTTALWDERQRRRRVNAQETIALRNGQGISTNGKPMLHKQKIIDMFKQGKKAKEIAATLNCAESSCRRVLADYKRTKRIVKSFKNQMENSNSALPVGI